MIVIQKKSISSFVYFNLVLIEIVSFCGLYFRLLCFGVAHGEHRIGSFLMQTAISLNSPFFIPFTVTLLSLSAFSSFSSFSLEMEKFVVRFTPSF